MEKRQLIQLIRLPVGLQNAAGLIHRHHRVITAVQNHPDDVGFCAFGVDGAGSVQDLLHSTLQCSGTNMNVRASDSAFPADIADSAAADNSVHSVPLTGVHRFISTFLVHNLVEMYLRVAELAQSGQERLQFIAFEAETNFLGMK